MSICSPSRFLISRKERGKILLNIIICLFALSITACNFDFFNSKSNPQSTAQKSNNNISVHQARDLASPATASEGFGDTPQINIERDGMRSSLGLNTNLLFADDISDERQRFIRLENAVQKISDKVDKMDPTVKGLAKVEQDLEELTEQLEILLTQDTIQPRIRGARNAQTTNQSAAALPQVIRAIRLADHAGKTRIVIETGNEIMYSANINGNMFAMNYKGAVPGFDLTAPAQKSKFINSISANTAQNETGLIFQLGKNSQIVKEGRIPPNKDNSNHRIYIDLKR